MTSGAAIVLKTIQNATTNTPTVACSEKKGGGWVNESEGRASHEIENALGDECGEAPTQRPEEHTNKVRQLPSTNMPVRVDRHESDMQRRQGVAGEQDKFLDDLPRGLADFGIGDKLSLANLFTILTRCVYLEREIERTII